uniref:WAP domain-containing protein n=1 Tax=Cyprinus carpio TaxID=7962 RepID=A0A8C1J0M7_CYPCA
MILLNSLVDGLCPARLTVVPSHRGCTSDKDCPGGYKCCQFDCGPVCVPPVFSDPGDPLLCTFFSCCILKWHTVYMHKLKLTVHAVKPGQCPIPEMTPLFAESCFHDGQCPATQKCCPTTGGFDTNAVNLTVGLFACLLCSVSFS